MWLAPALPPSTTALNSWHTQTQHLLLQGMEEEDPREPLCRYSEPRLNNTSSEVTELEPTDRTHGSEPQPEDARWRDKAQHRHSQASPLGVCRSPAAAGLLQRATQAPRHHEVVGAFLPYIQKLQEQFRRFPPKRNTSLDKAAAPFSPRSERFKTAHYRRCPLWHPQPVPHHEEPRPTASEPPPGPHHHRWSLALTLIQPSESLHPATVWSTLRNLQSDHGHRRLNTDERGICTLLPKRKAQGKALCAQKMHKKAFVFFHETRTEFRITYAGNYALPFKRNGGKLATQQLKNRTMLLKSFCTSSSFSLYKAIFFFLEESVTPHEKQSHFTDEETG